MRTSTEINELAKALAAAQGEIKNAHLNKVNPHFKSRYADLAAIRDAVIPALSKHGIAVMQTTQQDIFNENVPGFVVLTTLVHSSGQWIESEYPIPLVVDKPQIMGSAYTYARRYSLAAICGIAAEEDDDANAAQQSNGNGSRPVATYPKARSREPFARLDQQINKFTSLDELHEWRGMTKAERQKLDADFQIDLDFNYIIHGIGIADSEAALHAFWKDAYKNIMPGMPMDKQDALTGKKDEAKLRFIPLPTLAAG
jgi:hypothetical protein